MQASPRIGEIWPRLDLGFIGLAGKGDGAAGRLRDRVETPEVLVRTFIAESANRAVDDARIDLADVFEAKAELFDGPRREVLEEHVALANKPGENLFALFVLQ